MEGLDALKAQMHLDCMRDQVNAKYMRNLGTKLDTVQPLSEGKGYLIRYIDGDRCNEEGMTFSSQIEYICETDEKKHQSRPVF